MSNIERLSDIERQDFADRICKAWETKSAKMDWSGMERFLRDVLSSGMSAEDKVSAASEIIEAMTRRGAVGPSEPFTRSFLTVAKES